MIFRTVRRAAACAFVFFLIVLGVIAGGRALIGRPGPLAAPANIVVPRGGIERVANALAAARVIDRPLLFRIAALASRGAGPLHAAELAFPAHASIARVLSILRTAPPVEHALTIPEGLTAAAIAELLAAAPALRGALAVPREGGVLPQTYDYELGQTRRGAVRRMEAAMTAALERAWVGRAPGTGLRSPHELLVLASMVERETGVPGERPMVARVFLNRLAAGMRLQSDPTAAYAANGGNGPLDRPLTRSDLAFDNPYNTYIAPGLPPAPICSPGIAALMAVAHPAAGDALYFVADGSGGHVFAATLAEHDRNVERYRRLQGAAPDPLGPRAEHASGMRHPGPRDPVRLPERALFR